MINIKEPLVSVILNEAENLLQRAKLLAQEKQHREFILIQSLVSMSQHYRNKKEYEISDKIRSILNQANVDVIQGTSAYSYADIPESLKGNQFNDTWRFK